MQPQHPPEQFEPLEVKLFHPRTGQDRGVKRLAIGDELALLFHPRQEVQCPFRLRIMRVGAGQYHRVVGRPRGYRMRDQSHMSKEVPGDSLVPLRGLRYCRSRRPRRVRRDDPGICSLRENLALLFKVMKHLQGGRLVPAS